MTERVLSEQLALRIGLAVRVLPETDLQHFVKALIDAVGLPLSVDKLEKLEIKDLRHAGRGEFKRIDKARLGRVIRILRGKNGSGGFSQIPQPLPYKEGDLPGSVRVACASNSGELLNGHFGSCLRFLIYQVSADTIILVDVRSADGPSSKDDKNTYRSNLIQDCDLLYVNSVGGPAAARIVKAGVFPIKQPQQMSARELLSQLQERLAGSPPPWLAKVMGIKEKRSLDLPTLEK
jgi:nitrogen fixation protein NifX